MSLDQTATVSPSKGPLAVEKASVTGVPLRQQYDHSIVFIYEQRLWDGSLAQTRHLSSMRLAHQTAFDSPLPVTKRARVAFGEQVALYYLSCIGGRQEEYLLLRFHHGHEYQPGFDHVLLKYNGLELDAALNRAGTDYMDPALLDRSDLPDPFGLVIVEAKLTSRDGALRSYLPFNRSLGVRQMSKCWIAARAISHCDGNIRRLVTDHLEAGTVERYLIVRFPSRPTVRWFCERDFAAADIDDDEYALRLRRVRTVPLRPRIHDVGPAPATEPDFFVPGGVVALPTK